MSSLSSYRFPLLFPFVYVCVFLPSLCEAAPCGSLYSIANQQMEGNLAVTVGDTLSAGFNFNFGGTLPAAQSFYFRSGIFSLSCTCPGGAASILTFHFPDTTYVTAAASGQFPGSGQGDPKTYQLKVTAPALPACPSSTSYHCPGGASFSTYYSTSGPVVPSNFQIQMHYGDNVPATGTSWSASISGLVPAICKSGVVGDPQFTGFLGQQYQVHGSSNFVYNIISSPTFQYNALFRYLSEGRCRDGTDCFTHPGNYFGAVGLKLRLDDGNVLQISIQSGAVDVGMKVSVMGVELLPSPAVLEHGSFNISFISPFELVVESDQFNLAIQNSDYFLNQDVTIGNGLRQQIVEFKQAEDRDPISAEKLLASLPHGILGQTWRRQTYANRWKFIEGHLFDYVSADGLMGDAVKFNRFNA